MISANQRRKYIRVGTNLVAKISPNDATERLVYIKDVSAIGAKIELRDNSLQVGDVMSILFKYKHVLYDIICKIVRTDNNENTYGVQFYFKGENTTNTSHTNKNININSNKNKLHNDIIKEYFIYGECFR